MLSELDGQLSSAVADDLRGVLADLAARVSAALEDDLVGVYLVGSFALGAGDVHADVDFLVVTRKPLAPAQAARLRAVHAALPDAPSPWAQHLEGSYVDVATLRRRAGTGGTWWYVDNGSRDLARSAHDDTEVGRWVLGRHGLVVAGAPAGSVVGPVPRGLLAAEAARRAVAGQEAVASDPAIFANAWGQPHLVLTWCRLLRTAVCDDVLAKSEAARWASTRLAEEWRPLIEQAVADRPDPWGRVHRRADPRRARQTRAFLAHLTPAVVRAAGSVRP